MTASAHRPGVAGGFHALVGEIDGSSERIEIDEDGPQRAVFAAFAASSPFGHTLGDGSRFLGYFEPGNARRARDFPVVSIRRRGAGRSAAG